MVASLRTSPCACSQGEQRGEASGRRWCRWGWKQGNDSPVFFPLMWARTTAKRWRGSLDNEEQRAQLCTIGTVAAQDCTMELGLLRSRQRDTGADKQRQAVQWQAAEARWRRGARGAVPREEGGRLPLLCAGKEKTEGKIGLGSWGAGAMGSARKRVRERKRSRLMLPVEEPKRNWPCLLQRWGEQERDGRWGKDLKRKAADSLRLRQRQVGTDK
jgi:hypothetical protein